MPSGLKKKFPGSTNYELEGFVSSVMGLEFGTIPSISFGLSGPSNSKCDSILPGHANYRMFVLANSKLSSFANKLPGLENELPVSAKCELSGSMNYELSGSVNYELPGSTNYELFSLVNNESSDLVNNELSGFVNNELSGLVNFEVNSNLPSSMNFAVNNNFSDPMNSGFASNLPGSEGGSFNNWDAVQHAVDVYSKQHGFVAIKYRKDLDSIDRSIIWHHDYVCWKFGMNKPKKVENICEHCDGVSGTLLKELMKIIEQELEKEASYNCIRDYYRSNPSSGLPSTYNTIFKTIDLVLEEHLTPIPLSLQRAQMNQSLLYQGILVTIEQAKSSIKTDSMIEHLYDVPQIRLRELLLDILDDDILEIWEVFYIKMNSTAKSHYVVILKDLTVLCTSKTSVQIAVTEGVTIELIGILTQFITKYHCNTGLGMQETRNIQTENTNIITNIFTSNIESNNCHPLIDLSTSYNITEVSNPEYYKPRGRLPK
ncbi:9982_t:CDS:2 [Cetraspora pellucida]|uniref:9982_t:CDS:1 n=1 Tax=Cetraspora pellucida TaxID=1433469 RepID=A0ACA9KXE3_9GLOM|nr:9982_t:CDS:2 [Cetraspora pellucida]